MGREVLSEVAYKRVLEKVSSAGSATYAGEQRQKKGLGLHELVDPKAYGIIRRSLSWLEPVSNGFKLLRGVAILEETRLDTTGSMGGNVEVAMKVLPKTYELLATGNNPVLGRYDVQMITSIFGDVSDKYVLCRSQAEMDERIAEQMTLMVPEKDGGDVPEDPQYGLFAGAYLTQNSVNNYGLKRYDFTVSDAPGRGSIEKDVLIRIFGEGVFEKVAENGFQMNKNNLPSTKEAVKDLLERSHAFFLEVQSNSNPYKFWKPIFGEDRIVKIPEGKVNLLPYIKAAVCGLTEGVLDIQNLVEYLVENGLVKNDAVQIQRSVAHIPIGAQAKLPGFDTLPLRGAIFSNREDLYPMTIEQGNSALDLSSSDIEDPWF